MRSDDNARLGQETDFGHSRTVYSGSRRLSEIGAELRSIYFDQITASQPGDLVRMATLVDTLRRGPAPKDEAS